jgi:type IV pilus assembly protein PilW
MRTVGLSKQSGLSLVELMIAILIGSFITAGLLQLFVNSRATYRIQESLSRLQEEGRFATNFLTRDIRMAGYWGCLSSATQIESNLNPGASFNDFSTTITASDNDGLNGSDTIQLSGARGSGIYVVDTPATTSADLKVTDNSGLLENEIVLVSDCDKGDIFQITNDPSTGAAANKDELVHNTANSVIPGNADKNFQKIYGTDAQIYRMSQLSYSLQLGSNGNAALFRSINGASARELIPNIENMQILLGEDTDNDEVANRYIAPSTTGIDWSHIVSVRMALVIMSAEDNISSQPLSYTLFGNEITPSDKRLRRVMTSTVAIRNKLR